MTEEEHQAPVKRIDDHFAHYGYGWYAVELLTSGVFIGFIGFSHPSFESHFTNPQVPCVEIGWRLSSDYWGQEFATEGARTCFRYGFAQLGLIDVYSFTATINHLSERVMIKSGMQKVGEFDHPKLTVDSPLRRHVLYHMDEEMYLSRNSEVLINN